jgi:hypothetical protein
MTINLLQLLKRFFDREALLKELKLKLKIEQQENTSRKDMSKQEYIDWLKKRLKNNITLTMAIS